MEKNRKELKSFSFLILAIVAMELIRAIITLCITGVPNASEIPGGATENMVRAAYIITFALTFIVAIPQIYVGVKGIKIANGAKSGKAHIIWAVILAIFAGISLISGIAGIFSEFSIDAIFDILGAAIDLALFAFYYVYACRVAKGK
jgi:hypothetical protein